MNGSTLSQELISAANSGDSETLQRVLSLISQGSSQTTVPTIQSSLNNAFYSAATKGHSGIVQLLLSEVVGSLSSTIVPTLRSAVESASRSTAKRGDGLLGRDQKPRAPYAKEFDTILLYLNKAIPG